MVKTTVYLEADVALELRRLSAAMHRSQADLIRDAVRKLTTAAGPPPLPAGMGKFQGGKHDAARSEEFLMKAAKRGGWR
jgi:hypothetical protein